jgi:hypothetical protein
MGQTPVRYTITLEGTADAADVEDVRAAYQRAVQELRAAGVTVTGVLTGGAPAQRNEDDTGLLPAIVLHELAGDVPEAEKPKPRARHIAPSGKGPVKKAIDEAKAARAASEAATDHSKVADPAANPDEA